MTRPSRLSACTAADTGQLNRNIHEYSRRREAKAPFAAHCPSELHDSGLAPLLYPTAIAYKQILSERESTKTCSSADELLNSLSYPSLHGADRHLTCMPVLERLLRGHVLGRRRVCASLAAANSLPASKWRLRLYLLYRSMRRIRFHLTLRLLHGGTLDRACGCTSLTQACCRGHGCSRGCCQRGSRCSACCRSLRLLLPNPQRLHGRLLLLHLQPRQGLLLRLLRLLLLPLHLLLSGQLAMREEGVQHDHALAQVSHLLLHAAQRAVSL